MKVRIGLRQQDEGALKQHLLLSSSRLTDWNVFKNKILEIRRVLAVVQAKSMEIDALTKSDKNDNDKYNKCSKKDLVWNVVLAESRIMSRNQSSVHTGQRWRTTMTTKSKITRIGNVMDKDTLTEIVRIFALTDTWTVCTYLFWRALHHVSQQRSCRPSILVVAVISTLCPRVSSKELRRPGQLYDGNSTLRVAKFTVVEVWTALMSVFKMRWTELGLRWYSKM